MKKVFICFLVLSSCVSNNNKIKQEDNFINEPPYFISLEKEIDRINQTDLTEIGNTITYIPLETSDKSLLRDLRSIKVTDTYIAVKDIDLFVFNHLGDFITQIGKRGQGPGEYSTVLISYEISFDSKKIFLLVDNSTCLEYEMEGILINSYKLNPAIVNMLTLNDSLFVFYCASRANHSRPSPNENSLIISDLHNNIKNAYQNHFQKNNTQTTNNPGAPFYSYQGNIRFKEYGVDTLYTVTENELITYAIISLGQKELPTDTPASEISKIILGQVQSSKYFLKRIEEDNNNLYFTLDDFADGYLYGYYNKRTNNATVIGDKGFRNNIDGGLPFFPKYVYNDSILVDYVSAFTLREHVLNGNATEMKRLYGQKYDDLVNLVNNLDDESNPIVVMVKK